MEIIVVPSRLRAAATALAGVEGPAAEACARLAAAAGELAAATGGGLAEPPLSELLRAWPQRLRVLAADAARQRQLLLGAAGAYAEADEAGMPAGRVG